ncbi:uncharacterized protein LOC116140185 [Pistacia vera]|uniref:uncharacterized protein LOC116140185 n=1 Tax=Pistacia vera TaxID=55513 RepID=UPI001262B8C3|nr:uncharacterized protein LOC116140185 [Pistacia vera]
MPSTSTTILLYDIQVYTGNKDQTTQQLRTQTNHTEMGSLSFFAQRFNFSVTIFNLSIIFFISCSPSFVSSQLQNSLQTKPTAYEMLQTYDFPVGLLPKGVLDYDLEESSGKFSAFLNGSCSFSLEGSYQLKYKATIKGQISNGKLANLEGVSVKLLFMWVDIVEVSRHGDSIDFSVGIAGAGFPIDNFEECPQCGCGLNCGSQEVRQKMRKSVFFSSS